MESSNGITVAISHRGQNYSLSLLPDSTLSLLQQRLEELTSIPPSLQKLLYKGSKAKHSNGDDTTLSEAGIKDGTKIQLIGTTPKQLDGLKAEESEQQRKERIMRERAARAPTKLRSTGRANTSALSYRFHEIVPLPHLPNPEAARTMLNRLSDDPAIQHIMQKHQFSVGILTELAPHEHPELLGLNVNAGQQIKLRIRTNAYDGFRAYREIRKVLCHELTHNVWGDHDNNFKELNSKLNREVGEYERSVSTGTHTLVDGLDDVYEPSAEAEAEARAYVLGGNGSIPQTADERRRRILEATLSRLRKEDEELEDSCGTAGPSAL
ncbi:zinc metalloproteinase [Moniliophthora roreri MCA 2997]|uniref:Zinc metalloproteinase n=2 Tax=Moniliophthora roreri TaxID=221103 RepID=V2WL48_MONRO|nr:zinc metalloproteinase [Moniliophthora roreri MCA 2997]KAI3597800.1 zinc metalloproteinase [Moniliophthora roreri]